MTGVKSIDIVVFHRPMCNDLILQTRVKKNNLFLRQIASSANVRLDNRGRVTMAFIRNHYQGVRDHVLYSGPSFGISNGNFKDKNVKKKEKRGKKTKKKKRENMGMKP